MMIQPSESSTVEEATRIWPRSRLSKFMSRNTLATILIEEIDNATPRKSAVANRRLSSGNERGGQHQAERRSAEERNRDPGQGDAQGRPAQPLHQPQVALHAGQDEQEEDAELRERMERGLLGRVGRKQRLLEVRRDGPQKRGSEQNARDELPEHRRLAKTLGRLAEEARREQNDDDRDQKAGLEGHCDSLRAGDASSRPVRAISSVRRPRSDFAPDERESRASKPAGGAAVAYRSAIFAPRG